MLPLEKERVAFDVLLFNLFPFGFTVQLFVTNVPA
jgi:hypothetical protein